MRLPLDKMRWTLQEVSLPHIWPAETTACEEGPVVVSQLSDGNWFVHNGRHRCIRALLRGEKDIEAEGLYEIDKERLKCLMETVPESPHTTSLRSMSVSV